jgi:outer membrane protein assembly factor BamA
MRWPAQSAFLAAAFVLCCQPVTRAQSTSPSATAELQCPSPILLDHRQPSFALASVTFEGALQMPVADQDEITAALEEGTYSGDLDAVTSELLERVRRAWQERGYFSVQVHGTAKKLTGSPVKNLIAADFQVVEGQQYRLERIAFKNNQAIADPQVLRNLFPINDGDLFNTAKVSKGLEKLSGAYSELGYINFTSIPDTQINEESQTISLEVDVDEGKQFYVGSINVLGLDEPTSQNLLHGFLLKSGDVFNRRLYEMSIKHLSRPQSRVSVSASYKLDESVGTIAITISPGHCPAN